MRKTFKRVIQDLKSDLGRLRGQVDILEGTNVALRRRLDLGALLSQHAAGVVEAARRAYGSGGAANQQRVEQLTALLTEMLAPLHQRFGDAGPGGEVIHWDPSAAGARAADGAPADTMHAALAEYLKCASPLIA
jgi:hypothetical protein